jgi:hypothetical protein
MREHRLRVINKAEALSPRGKLCRSIDSALFYAGESTPRYFMREHQLSLLDFFLPSLRQL